MAKTVTLEISEEEAATLEAVLRSFHEAVTVGAEQARADYEEIDRLKADTLQLKEQTRRIADSTQRKMKELEATMRTLLPGSGVFSV